MINHFHLLVRSNGHLSESMRRVQGNYARWFNRSRERDGPLYKGRFFSCPVDTLRYRRNVVTYIHDNPVALKLVAAPTHYPWSSARHYAAAHRPGWLATAFVDEVMNLRGGEGSK